LGVEFIKPCSHNKYYCRKPGRLVRQKFRLKYFKEFADMRKRGKSLFCLFVTSQRWLSNPASAGCIEDTFNGCLDTFLTLFGRLDNLHSWCLSSPDLSGHIEDNFFARFSRYNTTYVVILKNHFLPNW